LARFAFVSPNTAVETLVEMIAIKQHSRVGFLYHPLWRARRIFGMKRVNLISGKKKRAKRAAKTRSSFVQFFAHQPLCNIKLQSKHLMGVHLVIA
jgi:hypothetical protein